MNEDVTGTPDEMLIRDYEKFKEHLISHRRFKYQNIQQLINKHANAEQFEIDIAGQSVEGRNIYLIKAGEGEKKILIWTQMHGNEPTATMALFDLLNFLSEAPQINEISSTILKYCTLYFIPVLNPDGMEANKRQNALDADLNRDSLRMAFPETRVLWDTIKKIKPHYAFNMHDQRAFYNVANTSSPATISFLAPAFDEQNTVNSSRQAAMQLIATLNQVLQKYIRGQVGEYSHEFYPTAAGDNIQKEGISTILVESGWAKDDPEKQQVRKWNYLIMLYGFLSISKNNHLNYKKEDYDAIPKNGKLLYDLLIRNATLEHNEQYYVVDIGINCYEKNILHNTDYYIASAIENIGDLSNYYGYAELDAGYMTLNPGKFYEEELEQMEDAENLPVEALLSKGITSVKVKNYDKEKMNRNLAIHVEENQDNKTESLIRLGKSANFTILKDNNIQYAIVNGSLIKIS